MRSIRGTRTHLVLRLCGVCLTALALWATLALMIHVGSPAMAILRPRLIVTPNPAIVPEGNTVNLDVVVTLQEELGGFSARLMYSPTMFHVESIDPGPMLGRTGRTVDVVSSTIDNDLGTVFLEATSSGQQPGPSSFGLLFSVSGTAIAAGESMVTFAEEDAALLYTDGSLIEKPYELIPARIVVMPGPQATPSATASATTTRTRTPPQSLTPTATMPVTPTATPTPTHTSPPTLTPTRTPKSMRIAYLPILRRAVLVNGSFESGTLVGWTASGVLSASTVGELYNGDDPKNGEYCVILGSPDYPCENGVPVGEAAISQQFSVPDEPNPRLVLFFRLFSQDASSQDQWRNFDRFEVRINNETAEWRANLEEGYGCEKDTYDSGWKELRVFLEEYRGKTVRLTLANVNTPDGYFDTWTYVDDIVVRWDRNE